MLAVRSVIKSVPQVRQMSVVAGPPSTPVSTIEKIIHGAVMGVACLSLPAYVLMNIRRYRGITD